MDWTSSDGSGGWYVRYSDGDAANSWRAMLAAARALKRNGQSANPAGRSHLVGEEGIAPTASGIRQPALCY